MVQHCQIRLGAKIDRVFFVGSSPFKIKFSLSDARNDRHPGSGLPYFFYFYFFYLALNNDCLD